MKKWGLYHKKLPWKWCFDNKFKKVHSRNVSTMDFFYFVYDFTYEQMISALFSRPIEPSIIRW